jgi:hypothetical protein
MIAPPAQMISSSSIPAASQKIRFLMIDNTDEYVLVEIATEPRFLAHIDQLKGTLLV